jgi:hypothetical protein
MQVISDPQPLAQARALLSEAEARDRPTAGRRPRGAGAQDLAQPSMTELQGLLERLVRTLESAGVPFMIAGSFASTVHGLPRTTQDLDACSSRERGIAARKSAVLGEAQHGAGCPP